MPRVCVYNRACVFILPTTTCVRFIVVSYFCRSCYRYDCFFSFCAVATLDDEKNLKNNPTKNPFLHGDWTPGETAQTVVIYPYIQFRLFLLADIISSNQLKHEYYIMILYFQHWLRKTNKLGPRKSGRGLTTIIIGRPTSTPLWPRP